MKQPDKGKTPAPPEDDAEIFDDPPEGSSSAEKQPAFNVGDSDAKLRQSWWGFVAMGPFELMVWKFLGKEENPWGFIPQQQHGGYIVDFYSQQFMLALEADGPVHTRQKAEDAERDADLMKLGIRTLRLTPGDFRTHSRQKIFGLIEEYVSAKQVADDEAAGGKNENQD